MARFRMLAGLCMVLLLSVLMLAAPVRAADVNDFTIRSFDANYYLSRDSARRSKLRVTEKIVADFPVFNQNHGLERAIPQEYDGHKVSLEITSVKTAAGADWEYATYDSNKHTVVRIGNEDAYVHGAQTFVISYTLRDVTKTFGDHDELYWDVNGLGWKQPFSSVTARLHLEGAVAAAFTPQLRCFAGVDASIERCESEVENSGDSTVITFAAGRTLYAGENMTIVTGFEKGTFAAYQPTTWERLLPTLIGIWLAASGVILLVVIGVLVHATRRFGRSPKANHTIVPEYIPPKDMHVLLAARIIGKTTHATTAQIMDLAVRHYIKIYETEAQSWFRRKRTYELELVKAVSTLHEEEKQLVAMVFGPHAHPGKRTSVAQLQAKLYKQNMALQKTVQQRAEAEGYLADRAHQRRRFYWIGGSLIAGGVLLLLPGALIAGVITSIVTASWHPLTEKGVERRQYLKGLKLYMKLAEAERIKQLQSPEGAAKGTVDVSDKQQLIKLYERLLPYAILFGIEKQWIKQFAPLYEQSPEWYAGNWSAFRGAAFATSLTGFTTVSNTVFTTSPDSFSSGFSSGGSSGGGGGGGGGGGW